MDEIKKIAVILLGPLGDMINATGVFRALKDNYKGSELTLITVTDGIAATEGIPDIDKVIIFHKKRGLKGGLEFFKFSKEIGKNGFDMIVVLDNTFRTAIMAFIMGAKYRIGRNYEGQGFLFTHKIPYLQEEKDMQVHISEHYMRILKPLGLYFADHKTEFYYTQEDESKVCGLLEQEGVLNKKLLGFTPSCFAASKSWNPQQAAKFVELVKTKTDYEIVIVGASNIQPFVDEMKKIYPNFVDMTGKTSFTQSGCLIDKCEKFVSIDSSPQHLALAFKTPVLALFFTTIFKKWGPKDLTYNKVLYSSAPSIIRAEEVFEGLQKLPEKSSLKETSLSIK